MNRLKRLWLQLYFSVMPTHVLVEYRRSVLQRLPQPPIEQPCSDEHNRFDPALPSMLRQQAD